MKHSAYGLLAFSLGLAGCGAGLRPAADAAAGPHAQQTVVAPEVAAPAVAPLATAVNGNEVPAPLQGDEGILQLRDVFELEWAAERRA